MFFCSMGFFCAQVLLIMPQFVLTYFRFRTPMSLFSFGTRQDRDLVVLLFRLCPAYHTGHSPSPTQLPHHRHFMAPSLHLSPLAMMAFYLNIVSFLVSSTHTSHPVSVAESRFGPSSYMFLHQSYPTATRTKPLPQSIICLIPFCLSTVHCALNPDTTRR